MISLRRNSLVAFTGPARRLGLRGASCTLLAALFCLGLAGAACTSDDTTDPANVDGEIGDGTGDIADDPAADPAADPTADPGTDPVADPTVDPTSDPTADPMADPTADPSADPADIADGSGAPDAAIEECVGVEPETTYEAPYVGEPLECPTCVGSPTPDWALTDFQAISCAKGEIYGLEAFRGAPTMVVLLSAGCSYCLGQTVKLEQLWWELQAAGHEFHFVVVNLKSMSERQQNLLDRASFPMFQDTDETNVWEFMGGGKDDFYFYDSEGTLAAWFPASGDVETTLSVDEGYANVRDAMLHLLGEDVDMPAPPEGSGE